MDSNSSNSNNSAGNSNSSSSSSSAGGNECNLVEKFIWLAARRFADNLIRQTCADVYFGNRSTAKFPHTLSVRDVYRTIVEHDRFDFLTNKHMAK